MSERIHYWSGTVYIIGLVLYLSDASAINSKDSGIEQESLSPRMASVYKNSLSALQKIENKLDLIIGTEE